MSVTASSSHTNDTANLSIEELMARKLHYIEKLEFEKARDIENMIQDKRRNDHSEALEKAKESIELRIQEIYDIYQDNLRIIDEKLEEAKLQIRENADYTFKDVQSRHLYELTQLEKEYALDIIRAHKKIVPEQLEQQRRAKELAKANDFEGACRLRSLAQQCFDDEHKARRAEIEKKTIVQRSQIFERQKSELIILNAKLGDALNRLQQTYENDIKTQDKQFTVSILAEKQRTLVKLTSSIKVSEVKRAMADELDKFFVQKTREISHLEIGSATSNPNTPQSSNTPRSQNRSNQQQSQQQQVTPQSQRKSQQQRQQKQQLTPKHTDSVTNAEEDYDNTIEDDQPILNDQQEQEQQQQQQEEDQQQYEQIEELEQEEDVNQIEEDIQTEEAKQTEKPVVGNNAQQQNHNNQIQLSYMESENADEGLTTSTEQILREIVDGGNGEDDVPIEATLNEEENDLLKDVTDGNI